MSNQKAITNMIRAISGQANVLTIPRIYISLTGSHRAALFLSQCVYWSDKTKDPEGWFYKTDAEWREELGMPRGGLETATRAVSKWVSTRISRVNGTPKTHYKVNLDLLVSDISEMLESGKSEMLESSKSDMPENSESTIRKITTKTTSADYPAAAADVLRLYEQNIGNATPIILEDITKAVSDYGAELVGEAIREMAIARAKSWRYAESCLQNWRANGRQTNKQADAPSAVKRDPMAPFYRYMEEKEKAHAAAD